MGLQQGSVVIRAGDTHLGSYPLSRTGGIVTLAPCTLSTQLIARIADLGIPLAIAGGSGRQIATVAGDTASRFAVSAAQAQKFSSLGDPGVCRIAADIVDAKLTNYVALVQQRGVPGTADLVRHLEAGRAALMQAATLDEVRGIEGDGARSCFPFIAGWIQQPGFPWEGRRRHGERPDRLNSLFNLGYHLLFTRINALLRVLGVNPYLGFLHAPNTRYEALTCDLQEPFRPYIDRLVIRLINLRVIGENDFHETDEGFWLTRSARAAFLQQFARELDRRPTKHRPSLAEILEAQAHGIGAWIRHDRPLNFHRWSGHDD